VILILVAFADRTHQVPDAVSLCIDDLACVLSFEQTVALRADAIAVEFTEWLAWVAILVIHIFHFENSSAEAVLG